MRVVFDSFQSYMMDSVQPLILPHQHHISPTDSSSPTNSHDNILNDPPNFNVLLTAAINATPTASTSSAAMHSNPEHLALNARMANTNTAMSIQSLLAGSEQHTQQHAHAHPHQRPNHAWPSTQPPSAFLPQPPSKGKRKHEDGDEEDAERAKLRKTVQEHLVMDANRVMSMTTVVCLHAAVAQKSYGSEKRFLCPPPIVRIEGPNQSMSSQQLSMSIVSEDGVRSQPQKAPLDSNMQSAFKHLHVAGTAKQKNFHLALDIASPPSTPTSSTDQPGKTWASFESAPVTIISKPSKKTAKTRNISSCILPGGPVSLFNRINSQTVRTKYMTIEHAALCASNTSWSAFNVNVVHRPPESSSQLSGPQPVTYGSQIVLTDALSGIATGSLIIRKVDKQRVSLEDGGPVSQMQKIALQRVAPDGSRQYLSAVGPLTSTGGVVTPPSPGANQPGGTHTLIFQSPRMRDESRDGVRIVIDEVDDYLCWTIVGISKFQYTFFDALGKNPTTPNIPLTPFPTLFTPPVYRANSNTLELTVSNFYGPSADGQNLQPLEVWLGSIGPLKQRVFPATLPGPLTSIASFALGGAQSPITSPIQPNRSPHTPPDRAVQPGTPLTPSADREPHSPTLSSHSSVTPPRQSALGPLHSIVVLEMPSVDEIVEAIHETLNPQAVPRSSSPRDNSITKKGSGNESEDEVLHAIDEPLSARTPSPKSDSPSHPMKNGQTPPEPQSKMQINPSSISGRSLPLLFIRPADGMGYHSGRSIVCENLIQNLTMNALANGSGGGNVDPGWIAAAHAAATADGTYGSAWNLRVM